MQVRLRSSGLECVPDELRLGNQGACRTHHVAGTGGNRSLGIGNRRHAAQDTEHRIRPAAPRTAST